MDDKYRAMQREADNLRDNMTMMNQNMQRSENAVERLNGRVKSQADEIEHLKLLNVQLRDIIEMNRKEHIASEENWNMKERKLREKVDDLEQYIFKQDNRIMNKYFDQAEAKFISKKHQETKGTNGDDILMKIDIETRELQSKKAEILRALEKDEIPDIYSKKDQGGEIEKERRVSERRRTPPKAPDTHHDRKPVIKKNYKPAEEKEKNRMSELLSAFKKDEEPPSKPQRVVRSKPSSGAGISSSGLPSLPGMDDGKKKSDKSKFSGIDMSDNFSDANLSEYWGDDNKKKESKLKCNLQFFLIIFFSR